MKIKVHGWHSRTDEDLCRSCSSAYIRKGTAQGEEIIICHSLYEFPQRITWPVVECTDYRNKNMPSLSEMNKIAWFITADRRTGKVGFVTGDKVDEKLKDEVHEAVD